MISNIQLCLQHRTRIKGRKKISFHPGLNIILGPNGSGKSSFLQAIYQCPDCKKHENGTSFYHYFNSETMNPHQSEESFNGLEGSLIKVRAMFSSHGETMRDVLRFLHFKKGDTLLLDEPETGHDFQWILKIRHGLDKISQMGCQIIMASHHPVFWDVENKIELQAHYKERTLNSLKKKIHLK